MLKFLLTIFAFCLLPLSVFAQCQYQNDSLYNGQPYRKTKFVEFGGGKFPSKNYTAMINSKAKYREDLMLQSGIQDARSRIFSNGNTSGNTFTEQANQVTKEIEQLKLEQANDAGFKLYGLVQLALFQGEKYIQMAYSVGTIQSATAKIGGIEKNSKLEFALTDKTTVTLYAQDDVAITPFTNGNDGGLYTVWYKIDEASLDKLKNTTLESWSFYSLKGGYTFNPPNPFYFKKNLDCIN